jgi:hypothetical protein
VQVLDIVDIAFDVPPSSKWLPRYKKVK